MSLVPEISILMPVKNADLYLKETLISIMDQSFKNWELIAVNDHSIDDSLKILNQFAKRDERVKVLNNEYKGIIPAMLKAFKESSAPFITRMDADDIMPNDKLQLLFERLNNRKKTVVTGKVKYFSDKEVSDGYLRYENWLNALIDNRNHFDHIYRECVIASPNWLVHRECFDEDISLQNLQYPEDYDMVFKWNEAGYKIDSINEITHLWREHAERTSRNSTYYQQESFFRLKTHYFINRFYPFKEPLQLIGNNQKTRLVKSIFEEENIDFIQFDNKSKGTEIKDVKELQSKLSILTNWPVDVNKQEEIKAFLATKSLYFGDKLWLF